MSKGPEDRPRLVSLGRIAGAHGIGGAVKVRAEARSATTDPADFLALGEVVIGGRVFQVLEASRHKQQVLLNLAGVDSRDRAEALTGQEVRGDRRRFPPLPAGEYYWFQVLGLPVLNAADGALLGYLEDILPAAGHDVYVVRQGEREFMLPAVEEVVTEINVEEGYIKAAPPPGLLNAYVD